MRICFLANANNYHTLKWVKWFYGRGHKISLVSFEKCTNEYLLSLNIDIAWIDSGATASSSQLEKVKFLLCRKKVAEAIERINPDIVHAHYATSYGLAAALGCSRPYCLSVYGSDIYEFPNKSMVHKEAIKYSLKRASSIYSTSEAMALETRKYTAKSIEITPFGVDMDLFHPGTKKPSSDRLNIGTVKRLDSKYGIDTLLKGVKLFHESHPNVEICVRVAGDGPQKDELIALAKSLGISDSVEWLGFISQDEAAEVWRSLDVAAITSEDDSESFGVSAVEAQASGVPLIVTDIPGLLEASDNGRVVKVIPRKNPEALSAAIAEIFFNDDIREQMAAQERAYVFNAYEINKCFLKVEDLYRKHLRLDGFQSGVKY